MSRNASGRKQGRKAINEEYRPSGRVDKVSDEGQRSRLILFARVRPKKPGVRKKQTGWPGVCRTSANRFSSLLLIPGAGCWPARQILQTPRGRRRRRSGWLLGRLLLGRLLSRGLLGGRLFLWRLLGRRLLTGRLLLR